MFFMTEKKLFIYQNDILYNILHEIEEITKYEICQIDHENLKSNFQDISNNLLLTKTKINKRIIVKFLLIINTLA